MSLVVFPFKKEDPEVVAANLRIASGHGRVDRVWAVAAAEGASMDDVADIAAEVTGETGMTVDVFPQERIGRLRPGKGDGMNTALRRAAEAGFPRVHFYDADITNFDADWIESAEAKADEGYDIVRHRFPRAATDAMVTWMVTRPIFAMTFPGTMLPRLGQPLGGELLLSREAVVRLAGNPLVSNRSDWGVDTVITYATATMGLPLYEHNVATGKRHALYGTLDELKPMVLECLDAARSLRGLPRPTGWFDADPPAPVPDDLKQTVAYDVDGTARLLTLPWSSGESELAATLPHGDEVLANQDEPAYRFMDADAWGDVLGRLLDDFVLGDPDWEALAFRLWLMRVLAYTTTVASMGYDVAIEHLEGCIESYEARALT
jgi:mannosylglycerate synthase